MWFGLWLIAVVLMVGVMFRDFTDIGDKIYEVKAGPNAGRWGKAWTLWPFNLRVSLNVEQTHEEYVKHCEDHIKRNVRWKKEGMEGFVKYAGDDIYHQHRWARGHVVAWIWQIRELSPEEHSKRDAEHMVRFRNYWDEVHQSRD